MIIEITIPDKVYEAYKGHSPKDPEKAIAEQLTKFSSVKPNDRILIINRGDRETLEVMFERHLDNSAVLVSVIQDLLKVKMEGIEIMPSPDSLALLKQQADFEGKPYKEFAKEKLEQGVVLAVQGF